MRPLTLHRGTPHEILPFEVGWLHSYYYLLPRVANESLTPERALRRRLKRLPHQGRLRPRVGSSRYGRNGFDENGRAHVAEMRAPLEKAVALRPDFFGSNALLGATLYTLKDDEPAYRFLDHAHQLNPRDTDTEELLFKVSVALAKKRFMKKEYTDCLNYLRKGAQLRPEDVEVHLRMAQVYGLLGWRTESDRENREAA